MEFKDLDPILHNELRLKVMAALDSLADADFVYLKELTPHVVLQMPYLLQPIVNVIN